MLALLMDEQLRVTDDVDEQDMPDLELHFRGSLGRRRIWIHRVDPSFGEEALATSGSPLYALPRLRSAKKFFGVTVRAFTRRSSPRAVSLRARDLKSACNVQNNRRNMATTPCPVAASSTLQSCNPATLLP